MLRQDHSEVGAALAIDGRALTLVWQDPDTRTFTDVGRLWRLVDGRFAFQYTLAAVESSHFRGVPAFPDATSDEIFVSRELPGFFANRVLSKGRRSYGQYLDWLGIADLDDDEIPFEMLARTGASRATDTFHVVETPRHDASQFLSRFFVSGLRHGERFQELERVSVGDVLGLQPEPGNPSNPLAVRVDSGRGAQLGYVPDWLCADICTRIGAGWSFVVTAERVNLDAPPHVQLLVSVAGSAQSKLERLEQAISED